MITWVKSIIYFTFAYIFWLPFPVSKHNMLIFCIVLTKSMQFNKYYLILHNNTVSVNRRRLGKGKINHCWHIGARIKYQKRYRSLNHRNMQKHTFNFHYICSFCWRNHSQSCGFSSRTRTVSAVAQTDECQRIPFCSSVTSSFTRHMGPLLQSVRLSL